MTSVKVWQKLTDCNLFVEGPDVRLAVSRANCVIGGCEFFSCKFTDTLLHNLQ